MPRSKSMRRKKGGDGYETPVKKNAQQKHMDEKRILDKEKREKNKKAIAEMQRQGKYLEPEYEGPRSDFVAPDGTVITPRTRNEMVRRGKTVYTDVSKMQRDLFSDPMEFETGEAIESGEVKEDPNDPIYGYGPATFGGKKRKTNKRRKSNKNKRKKTKRRSRRKNTRRKKGGEKTKNYVSKAEALKEYDLEEADEITTNEYVKKCGTKNPFTGKWYWSKSDECNKMVKQYWKDQAANKSREDMYYDALDARNVKSEEELKELEGGSKSEGELLDLEGEY